MSEVDRYRDGQIVPNADELDHDEKCLKAVQLRKQGYSWVEVAKHCKYPDMRTAMVEVRRYLQLASMEQDAERKQLALTLELERLDELQKAYWDEALGGEIKAAEYVLKVMAQRSRLMQWEDTEKNAGGTRTVVIAGTHEEYVAALKQIAEGS